MPYYDALRGPISNGLNLFLMAIGHLVFSTARQIAIKT